MNACLLHVSERDSKGMYNSSGSNEKVRIVVYTVSAREGYSQTPVPGEDNCCGQYPLPKAQRGHCKW